MTLLLSLAAPLYAPAEILIYLMRGGKTLERYDGAGKLNHCGQLPNSCSRIKG